MNDEQQALLTRLDAFLRPDDRFRALYLTGSLAAGGGDEFSDVDTLVVVEPTAMEQVRHTWAEIVRPLGPFVLTKHVPHSGVLNYVLPGWLRWDVTLVSSHHVPPLVEGRVRPVFEKDVFPRTRPAAGAREPNPQLLTDIAAEFLRCLALLPVVIGREEYVAGRSGVDLLRQHTVALLRELDHPGGQAGALHLRDVLTPEHYAALAALPPAEATRRSVIDGHRALRDLFLPAARAALGDSFPDALAEAALNHVAPLVG